MNLKVPLKPLSQNFKIRLNACIWKCCLPSLTSMCFSLSIRRRKRLEKCANAKYVLSKEVFFFFFNVSTKKGMLDKIIPDGEIQASGHHEVHKDRTGLVLRKREMSSWFYQRQIQTEKIFQSANNRFAGLTCEK